MKSLIAISCLLLLWGTAWAAPKERASQPIQIKSDQLTTDNAAGTATFTGKVTARQADVTMAADKLVVFYSAKGKEVEKVEAFGGIRISQGSRLAQSGHAVYDNTSGKIVLDDNPKVFQGDNVVAGKIITFFVDEEKSVVTGGPGSRVEAVIHPKDKGSNDGSRP